MHDFGTGLGCIQVIYGSTVGQVLGQFWGARRGTQHCLVQQRRGGFVRLFQSFDVDRINHGMGYGCRQVFVFQRQPEQSKDFFHVLVVVHVLQSFFVFQGIGEIFNVGQKLALFRDIQCAQCL